MPHCARGPNGLGRLYDMCIVVDFEHGGETVCVFLGSFKEWRLLYSGAIRCVRLARFRTSVTVERMRCMVYGRHTTRQGLHMRVLDLKLPRMAMCALWCTGVSGLFQKGL